jgi:CheY-like chemotaxis protein
MPTILAIDDDPDMLATLRAMLEPAGFDVTVAANMADAIAKVNIAAPACIITDIYMPGGDGFELIAALRRYRIPAPIIAMSGGTRDLHGHDHMEIARRLGAVETIEKPFRSKELIETVERVIGGGLRETGYGNDTDGR